MLLHKKVLVIMYLMIVHWKWIPPIAESFPRFTCTRLYNIDDLTTEETNIQNIPPETLDQFGGPETSTSDSLENVNNQK